MDKISFEDSDEERRFDDWVEQQEADQFDRWAAVPRPPELKIAVTHGTEGPREDPYGWSEWHITMPDGRKAMWRQGLLSERLELDSDIGKVTFFSPDYDESLGSYEQLFSDFVGYDMSQIEYWANIDYEKYSMVLEAEMDAGWDPSP